MGFILKEEDEDLTLWKAIKEEPLQSSMFILGFVFVFIMMIT